jgi:hypothetical protein
MVSGRCSKLFTAQGRAQVVAVTLIPRKATAILLAGGSVTVDASNHLALTLTRLGRAAVKGRGRLIITGTRDLPPLTLAKISKAGAEYVVFRQ